jgi:hypothetical protein
VDKVSSGMPNMINEDQEMKNNAVMNKFNKMNQVSDDKSEKKENDESALAQDVNLENDDNFKDA